MSEEIEDAEVIDDNGSSITDTAIRLLFVVAVVILQFGFKFITGDTNAKLLSFNGSLNRYIYEILQFVSFRDDDKPFPFDDWPSEPDDD